MSLTNWAILDSWDLRSEPLRTAPIASLDGQGRVPSPISNGRYGITSDVLSIGSRVCVRGRLGTCGRVVRLMPMTRRVVVRLDPPHPSWRGTLRSFHPEHLVICS